MRKVWWFAGAFVGLGLLGIALPKHPKSAPPPASSAHWEPYAEHDQREAAIAARNRGPSDCLLTIPGSHGSSIPLFPTESGMDEFASAATHGDQQAELVALRSNGGVMVDPKSRCAYLDRGIARSRVRVVDGPAEGRSGWVPSEWTRGE